MAAIEVERAKPSAAGLIAAKRQETAASASGGDRCHTGTRGTTLQDDEAPSPEQLAGLVGRARARSGGADAQDAAAAFGLLIRHYERTALALAYSTLGGDAATAGDVAQEAFLRAWQRLDELKQPDRFPAWLARMVRNLAIDARRRRGARREALGDLAQVDHPAAAGGSRDGAMRRSQSSARSLESAGHDPLGTLDRHETAQRIDRAMSHLDEQSRQAVVLRYYENLSSKQIGELLELSPAAVDMRLSRARAQLRERLSAMD
jgi:RNA polymerase sigma factor (sigma-70 family)